jgi:hypothetical protein
MRQIEELVGTLLPEGHMIYHLDVCVATRRIDNPSNGAFRRFPGVGTDPLLSGGVLMFLLDELRVRMNPNLDLRRRD